MNVTVQRGDQVGAPRGGGTAARDGVDADDAEEQHVGERSGVACRIDLADGLGARDRGDEGLGERGDVGIGASANLGGAAHRIDHGRDRETPVLAMRAIEHLAEPVEEGMEIIDARRTSQERREHESAERIHIRLKGQGEQLLLAAEGVVEARPPEAGGTLEIREGGRGGALLPIQIDDPPEDGLLVERAGAPGGRGCVLHHVVQNSARGLLHRPVENAMSAAELVAAHRAAGRLIEAGGVSTFVREAGSGEAVLCLHGVPASSFLYRRVLDELAGRGLHGIAYDLPGLGLSERPVDFDYSWTGLGAHARGLVDALGLERFHLVVHDIGGPVGFELAAAMPKRIASLTALNTIVDVAGFRRPWSMEPFAIRGLGRVYLRLMTKPAFRALVALQGIGDRSAVTSAELDAYVELLRLGDGGRAFLRIMRGFERTNEKQALYRGAIGNPAYPRQIIWGERDPALRLGKAGEEARRAAGVDVIRRVPGRHFLQEDCAAAIAAAISEQAQGAGGAAL